MSSCSRRNRLGVKPTAEGPSWDRKQGELRIHGRRYLAFDAQPFCEFLDSLIGERVAEVLIKNLQSRYGKEDGLRLRKENPNASLDELIRITTELDRMAGVGVTQASLVGPGSNSIALKISNPSVKGSKGAAKAFFFAWWAGVMSSYLGKDFDYANVVYDQETNTMNCEILPRNPP